MTGCELDQWGRPTGPGLAWAIASAPTSALAEAVKLLDNTTLAQLNRVTRKEVSLRQP